MMEPAQGARHITAAGAILLAGGFIALAIAVTGRLPEPPPSAPALVTDSEPYIGSPTAPVTLAYWFDFQCPYCKLTETSVMPQLVRDYVDTGIVKVVFKDLQFLGPNSEDAGVYARAVWDADPARYYQWHQAVFSQQDAENDGWGSASDLAALTKELFGDGEAARVEAMVSQKRAAYVERMGADRVEGARLGITATPGFLINGTLVSGSVPYADMKASIESARRR